ncbi:MAG: DUF2225 domain-containing protein [Syntrophomonadaceae bacterium]|jgi:uncharacterized protein (DUF2225 family)/CRP-like cAMP-binding protein
MVDIGRLAQSGIIRKYQTDEVFFDQGDPGNEMFILLKGKAQVLINSVDGFTVPVSEVKQGDFFGEMSLLENLPRSATVMATEECLAMVITKDNFEQIIADQPSLAIRIMKGMSQRLRQLNEEKVVKGKDELSAKNTPTVESGDIAAAELNLPADSGLFPPQHKTYAQVAPASDEDYLFTKEAVCPVCTKSFPVKMIRSSKLKLEAVDRDLRQRFKNFNPLWYIMWVCPHCFYANFHFEFKQVNEKIKKNIKKQLETLQDKINPRFSSPRNLNEVFTAYYLAINGLKDGVSDPARLAKIWLRLAWLYEDVEDQDMYCYASEQALKGFEESYYNGRRNTSIEQDQRLTLLMGELNLRIGKSREALVHFRNSIVHKGGSPIINRQAEDRIQELKSLGKE